MDANIPAKGKYGYNEPLTAGTDRPYECVKCKLPIEDGVLVRWSNNPVHDSCFVCDMCHRGLSGIPYMTGPRDGVGAVSPYCVSCWNEKQHTAFHAKPTSTASSHSAGDQSKPTDCGTQQTGTFKNCSYCGERSAAASTKCLHCNKEFTQTPVSAAAAAAPAAAAITSATADKPSKSTHTHPGGDKSCEKNVSSDQSAHGVRDSQLKLVSDCFTE